MTLKNLWRVLAVIAVGGAVPVQAEEIGFSLFMASASGAAGLSAAISSLGACDTTPEWTLGAAPEEDRDSQYHAYVGCQYDPADDDENVLYDKGVLAKFVDYDGVLYLHSLTKLP